MKTIRETCALTGTTRRTLQEYARIGLIGPTAVTSGGYWMYDDESIAKISLIRVLSRSGCPRREIGQILEKGDSGIPEALAHAADRTGKSILALQKRKNYLELLSLISELLDCRVPDFPGAVRCCEPFLMSAEELGVCLAEELPGENEPKDAVAGALRLFGARLAAAAERNAEDVRARLQDLLAARPGLPLLEECFGPGSAEYVMNLLGENQSISK